MKTEKGNSYIIYDDRCTLCQKAIGLFSRADKNNTFTYLPFSQQEAKEKMVAFDQDSSALQQVIVIKEERLLKGADAILEAMKTLAWQWRIIASCVSLLPPMVRNRTYNWIARHRGLF